jgi:hypothetical protein
MYVLTSDYSPQATTTTTNISSATNWVVLSTIKTLYVGASIGRQTTPRLRAHHKVGATLMPKVPWSNQTRPHCHQPVQLFATATTTTTTTTTNKVSKHNQMG